MTINANVRCVEWHNASHVTPVDARYVLGWYEDGLVRVVRLNGDTWHLEASGPGSLRQECAKPTHWCDFPEGPHACRHPRTEGTLARGVVKCVDCGAILQWGAAREAT